MNRFLSVWAAGVALAMGCGEGPTFEPTGPRDGGRDGFDALAPDVGLDSGAVADAGTERWLGSAPFPLLAGPPYGGPSTCPSALGTEFVISSGRNPLQVFLFKPEGGDWRVEGPFEWTSEPGIGQVHPTCWATGPKVVALESVPLDWGPEAPELEIDGARARLRVSWWRSRMGPVGEVSIGDAFSMAVGGAIDACSGSAGEGQLELVRFGPEGFLPPICLRYVVRLSDVASPFLHAGGQTWLRQVSGSAGTGLLWQDLLEGEARTIGLLPNRQTAFLPGLTAVVLTSTGSRTGIGPGGRYVPGGLRRVEASFEPPGLTETRVETGLERLIDSVTEVRALGGEAGWLVQGVGPDGQPAQVLVDPDLRPQGRVAMRTGHPGRLVASSSTFGYVYIEPTCSTGSEVGCVRFEPVTPTPIDPSGP